MTGLFVLGVLSRAPRVEAGTVDRQGRHGPIGWRRGFTAHVWW